jgi:hypothetical protein
VVGDSFVEHLRRYYESRYPSGLWVHAATVSVYGLSGASVCDVGYYLADNLKSGQFSVVVLCCGSNDLCRSDRSEDVVAHDLLSLARFLVR